MECWVDLWPWCRLYIKMVYLSIQVRTTWWQHDWESNQRCHRQKSSIIIITLPRQLHVVLCDARPVVRRRRTQVPFIKSLSSQLGCIGGTGKGRGERWEVRRWCSAERTLSEDLQRGQRRDTPRHEQVLRELSVLWSLPEKCSCLFKLEKHSESADLCQAYRFDTACPTKINKWKFWVGFKLWLHFLHWPSSMWPKKNRDSTLCCSPCDSTIFGLSVVSLMPHWKQW